MEDLRYLIIRLAKELGRNPDKLYHSLYESFFYRERINWHKLLDELEKSKEDDYLLRKTIERISSLQRPTKERLPFYEKIWGIHDFSDIVDIGCGLNPLSVFLANKQYKRYLALDISPQILNFLKKAFEILGKNLEIAQYNFFDLPNFEGEVALLWKVIPIMYRYKGHGYVLTYLNKLSKNFNYISISYPRKSLGRGKPIGRAWKGYTKKIAEKLNLKIVKELEIPSEYFVILSSENTL